MSLIKQFAVNISWNIFGKICTQVLLFVTSILITRYLGKDFLGVYATLLVIPAFIRLLNAFGLETVVNKKLPELNTRERGTTQSRYLLRRLIIFRLFSTAGFCVLLYILLPVYFEWIQMLELIEYRAEIIAYFIVITWQSLFSTLFMTLLKYKINAILETANALLNIGFLALFIVWDWQISAALWAYIFATAIVIGAFLLLALSELKGPEQKPEPGDTVHLAWTSYAVGIFSFGLLTQSDVVLMNYFQVESTRVGFYHLATGLGVMLTFVLNGIGPLALSVFSETYSRDSYAGLSQAWRQILSFVIFLTLPVYLFAIFNARNLITFIYGTAFAGAGSDLEAYIIFLLTASTLGSGFSTSVLYVIDRKDIALRSTIEGSILNIVLNLFLIPLYHELGAIVSTGVIQVYMAVRQAWVLKKHIDIRPALVFAGQCFLVSLAGIAVSEGIALIWIDHVVSNLLSFGLALTLILTWLKPLSPEQGHWLDQNIPSLSPWISWLRAEPSR